VQFTIHERISSFCRLNLTVISWVAVLMVTGRALFGPPLTIPIRAADSAGIEARRQQPPPPTPDIHFAATPQAVVDAMLTLAHVTPRDVVYDLGSGDGRIVILAAQKYGARGVGIEIDPRLVAISRQVAQEGDVSDRVTFIEGDMFTKNISEATVVTMWLSPFVNDRLEPKLREELRPGARIVSHQFRIGRWTPDQTIRASDGTELYLWTVPAR
jgi:SAM-dependent methyltransferase